MVIVVPLNMAPDLVEDLQVDSSGVALDEDDLKFKLNEFDDHALEEALLIKESGGAEVVAIALESDNIDKALFTALAKGADKAVKITGAGAASGNRNLGSVFAAAAKELGADLVLTGVQSVADLDGQLGPAVAAALNAPFISVATSVTVSGNIAQVRKEYAGGVTADFEMDLPAVVGVQAARQTPRYAPVSKVRQIQQSATLDELAASPPASGNSAKITALAPPDKGAGAKMLSSTDELIAVLREAGVAS